MYYMGVPKELKKERNRNHKKLLKSNYLDNNVIQKKSVK